MGSAASKPIQRAAGSPAVRRQYPKQPAPATAAPSAARAAAQPQAREPSAEQKQEPAPPRQPEPEHKASQAHQPLSYPTREPENPQGPVYHSSEKASLNKSNAIDLDGRDPHFAASLRSIGPVNPAPTYSHSSTFKPENSATPQPDQSAHPVFPQSATNPALLVLSARESITQAAEREAEQVGKPSFAGREFVDAMTIRQAISMRDKQGLPPSEIESTLQLRKGVVERLGKRGIVSEA